MNKLNAFLTRALAIATVAAAVFSGCKSPVDAPDTPVSRVALNQAALSLDVGDTRTLKATVEPAAASNKTVVWSSSDVTVAVVDDGGTVTAVGLGVATIKATTLDGGKVASCRITVGGSNAATPVITAQPTGRSYMEGASATALTVTASISDGGSLAYQWFRNTVNSTSGGAPISGATGVSYTPPTADEGTVYYYVVVTNMNSGVSGTQTAAVTSFVAAIAVSAANNAATPVITGEPTDASYTQNRAAAALTVTAVIADLGTLSYQWFVNAGNNAFSGQSLGVANGAQTARYTPPTDAVGTRYYYVVVTNTNTGVSGIRTATAVSGVAAITVGTLTNAATPFIITEPRGGAYYQGVSAAALTVAASVSDGGTLKYQWFRETSYSNSGGTPLGTANGAQTASYTPSTAAVGTFYYYVIITNTKIGVSGTPTAQIRSVPVAVGVSVPSATAGAALPLITVQPRGGDYTGGSPIAALTVMASSADIGSGGNLSYQWYSTGGYGPFNGTPISGATASSYTPPAGTLGTYYYYVEVTNRNTRITGNQSASVYSAIVVVRVLPQTPNISVQPASTSYVWDGTASDLRVAAYVSDGGVLTYQWFKNTSNSNSGGQSLGSKSPVASCTPPTDTLGTFYYYVVVTNTLNGITVTATSNTASIVVNPAQAPNIIGQPMSARYAWDGTASDLRVVAKVSDGGTLSYEWFKNTSNSNSNGLSLGSDSPIATSYMPPTDTEGTVYYYVVVTNTVNGHTETKTSDVVAVTVVPPQAPNITGHPASASYVLDRTASALRVAANVSDGGTLSYEWFKNTSSSNSDGLSLGSDSPTATSYAPPTDTEGTVYYYVVVTNTVNGHTETKTSDVVAVTVVPPQAPNITGHPASASYVLDRTASALRVAANVSDDGTLSYQWWKVGSPDVAITGQNNSSYMPPTDTLGTFSYYVVVTNTINSHSVATTSNAAMVTVATVVLPQAPGITGQPADARYLQGDRPIALMVAVDAGDGGLRTYQWFKNTSNSNSGGQPLGELNGAQTANYAPPTNEMGTVYYYVVVTNEKNGYTATTTSNAARVDVIVHAKTPNITYRPEDASYLQGDTPTALRVVATIADLGTGGGLSYQWYKNLSNSNSDGTEIDEATGPNYTPPTDTLSTVYYYVVVKNTNTRVNGAQIVTITSNPAMIFVYPRISVTSAPFTSVIDNHTLSIKLTGGTYITTPDLSQFTLTGTAGFTTLTSGVVTSVSDTEVTISKLDPVDIAGSGQKITVAAAAFATQTPAVAAVTVTAIGTVSRVFTLAGNGTEGHINSTGLAARFSKLQGGAALYERTLYVTDWHRIRKIDIDNGRVSDVTGKDAPGGYLDGPLGNAKFRDPHGIAVDSIGNIYVADTGNHCIRKIDFGTREVTTVAGDGAPGDVTTGQFREPKGIAVYGGMLYVADTGNHSIRRINIENGSDILFAGRELGYLDLAGVGAEFNGPEGIAADGNGKLYVADAGNNRIRKIRISGVWVDTVAGDGFPGHQDGPALDAWLWRPATIVADSENLYVTTISGIRKINIDAGQVTTVGWGWSGTASSTAPFISNGRYTETLFKGPCGIARDATSGYLYVVDTDNYCIRTITP
ncbi:hypothetical protein AGMMS50267_01550 [Spirochaetia bacterium]|nr:hypothetical protein AGMMS50267_01550 [Spirochaetia bacterium]